MANVTDSSNFYVSRSANVSDMHLHRQVAAKCNIKIFFLRGREREYQHLLYEWRLAVDLEKMFYLMQSVEILFYYH